MGLGYLVVIDKPLLLTTGGVLWWGYAERENP